MLDRLADTFIAGVELLEAEGRVARDQAAQLATGAAVLVACAVGGVLGLVTAAVGLTLLLSQVLGTGGALAIVGGTVLAVSALVGLTTARRLKGPGEDPEPTDADSDAEGLDRTSYPPEYPA